MAYEAPTRNWVICMDVKVRFTMTGTLMEKTLSV